MCLNGQKKTCKDLIDASICFSEQEHYVSRNPVCRSYHLPSLRSFWRFHCGWSADPQMVKIKAVVAVQSVPLIVPEKKKSLVNQSQCLGSRSLVFIEEIPLLFTLTFTNYSKTLRTTDVSRQRRTQKNTFIMSRTFLNHYFWRMRSD